MYCFVERTRKRFRFALRVPRNSLVLRDQPHARELLQACEPLQARYQLTCSASVCGNFNLLPESLPKGQSGEKRHWHCGAIFRRNSKTQSPSRIHHACVHCAPRRADAVDTADVTIVCSGLYSANSRLSHGSDAHGREGSSPIQPGRVTRRKNHGCGNVPASEAGNFV